MRTAIVMLTWNNIKRFKNTMNLFLKFHNGINDKDIYIVNNGSIDGTTKFLGATNYNIINNEINLGCQMGKYIGWSRALEDGYDFILFIEDDHECTCTVPIKQIEKYLDDNTHIGMVRVYEKPDKKIHMISLMKSNYENIKKFIPGFKIQESDYNFSSHPSIFRVSLVPLLRRCVYPEKIRDKWQDFKCFKKLSPTEEAIKRCEKSFGLLETEYMRLFMKHYRWTARIFPSCFKHNKISRYTRKGWRN